MPEPVGDLATVLHSHMPYVEGFGTYPFGEEWLFDAVIRSYLPVLEVAEAATVTVTPILADQLEANGVAPRLRGFAERYRLGAAEADREVVEPAMRAACEDEARRYREALERLDVLEGDLLSIFRAPAAEGRVELVPSAATHAVLPLLATRAGRRLQIDAGLRSHARRFGGASGFWLPECAYEPGVDELLAERGIEFFCVDQSAHEDGLDALSPVVSPAGPVAFTIDWEAISLLWSLEGYPSDEAYADFHRRSMAGTRLWSIGGNPYDPERARAVAERQAKEFAGAIAARLERYRRERGRRGLVVFAVDTELIGHWWWEGPIWLTEAMRALAASGVELVTLSEALGRHEPEERPLRRSTWGERKDLSTWDSPEVADLAWAIRRLELRLIRALSEDGIPRATAERATRELLAVQASDWAFLDKRRQAGDYPFQRATDHALGLLEAIHSADPADPWIRNVAPDLSLAPLLEP